MTEVCIVHGDIEAFFYDSKSPNFDDFIEVINKVVMAEGLEDFLFIGARPSQPEKDGGALVMYSHKDFLKWAEEYLGNKINRIDWEESLNASNSQ